MPACQCDQDTLFVTLSPRDASALSPGRAKPRLETHQSDARQVHNLRRMAERNPASESFDSGRLGEDVVAQAVSSRCRLGRHLRSVDLGVANRALRHI